MNRTPSPERRFLNSLLVSNSNRPLTKPVNTKALKAPEPGSKAPIERIVKNTKPPSADDFLKSLLVSENKPRVVKNISSNEKNKEIDEDDYFNTLLINKPGKRSEPKRSEPKRSEPKRSELKRSELKQSEPKPLTEDDEDAFLKTLILKPSSNTSLKKINTPEKVVLREKTNQVLKKLTPEKKQIVKEILTKIDTLIDEPNNKVSKFPYIDTDYLTNNFISTKQNNKEISLIYDDDDIIEETEVDDYINLTSRLEVIKNMDSHDNDTSFSSDKNETSNVNIPNVEISNVETEPESNISPLYSEKYYRLLKAYDNVVFKSSDIKSCFDFTESATTLSFLGSGMTQSLKPWSLYQDHVREKPVTSNLPKKKISNKEQIIENNKKVAKERDAKKDLECLAKASKQLRSYKTLYDIQKNNSSLKLEESLLTLLCNVFEVTQYEELKKNLYIEIQNRINDGMEFPSKSHRKKMEEYSKTFTRNDQIDFAFKFRRDVMKPFSPLKVNETKVATLDKFQLEMIEKLKERKNLIVCAGTSSGKTFCARVMPEILANSSLEEDKSGYIVYVTATIELVRQLAQTIRDEDDKSVMTIYGDTVMKNSNSKIIVSTPNDLWRYLMLEKSKSNPDSLNYHQYSDVTNNGKSTNCFDHYKIRAVVFDEVHIINNNTNESKALQRLLGYLKHAQYLLLSATIGNLEHVAKWLRYIKKNTEFPIVDTIVHNKRFINQNFYTYTDNGTTFVSPLSVLTLNMIQEGKLFMSGMQFPPEQLPHLANLYTHISGDEQCSIYQYFENKDITLETCKEYETLLKQRITELSNTNPDMVSEILQNYILTDISLTHLGIPELYKILMEAKHKNQLNAIVFVFDGLLCKKTCHDLLNYMRNEESERYPLWYTLLELQNEFHEKMQKELLEVKVSKSTDDSTSTQDNLQLAKETKSELILNDFKRHVESLINKHLKIWEAQPESELRDHLIRTYTQERNKYMYMGSLSKVNPYEPHKDYTFRLTSVQEREMKNLRIEMSKMINDLNGTDRSGKKIRLKELELGYTDEFFCCVERGFAYYSENIRDLDPRFQALVQRLFTDITFSATILFTDESLLYGINMPFKTAIFYNPEFETNNVITLDINKAFQGSGRAGRRGLCTTANTICIGINHTDFILGEYLNIVGDDYYNVYDFMPMLFNDAFVPSDMCSIPLHSWKDISDNSYDVLAGKVLFKQLIDLPKTTKSTTPMYLYRLYELTDNPIDLQNVINYIADNNYGQVSICQFQLLEMISSVVYHNDNDDGNFTNNNTINDITRIRQKHPGIKIGKSLMPSRFHKGNNVPTNSADYNKLAKISSIIRLLYSFNSLNVQEQWVIYARELYIDLNKLLFRAAVKK